MEARLLLTQKIGCGSRNTAAAFLFFGAVPAPLAGDRLPSEKQEFCVNLSIQEAFAFWMERKSFMEALMKSARADDERFWLERKCEKCGNTLCISHFYTARLGQKIRQLPQAIYSAFP